MGGRRTGVFRHHSGQSQFLENLRARLLINSRELMHPSCAGNGVETLFDLSLAKNLCSAEALCPSHSPQGRRPRQNIEPGGDSTGKNKKARSPLLVTKRNRSALHPALVGPACWIRSKRAFFLRLACCPGIRERRIARRMGTGGGNHSVFFRPLIRLSRPFACFSFLLS